MELYKKYRPETLAQVYGNKSTTASLLNMLDRNTLPHTILFYGESGCGKTTLARILKDALGCLDMNWNEMNCSDFRGVDSVREISRSMMLSAVGSGPRIYLLDEVHQWTANSQDAALKMLEDTPKHVYFFLCTTDPQKLKKAIRTRCCEMPVEPLGESDMIKLLREVSKKEKIKLTKSLAEDIADAAEGSARKALVLLDKVKNLRQEERADAINVVGEKKEGVLLLRALTAKNPSWTTVTGILKELTSDPESLRYSVLGYCNSILMKKKDDKIFHVMSCFEKNYYDTKKFGLTMSCYEAIFSEF